LASTSRASASAPASATSTRGSRGVARWPSRHLVRDLATALMQLFSNPCRHRVGGGLPQGEWSAPSAALAGLGGGPCTTAVSAAATIAGRCGGNDSSPRAMCGGGTGVPPVLLRMLRCVRILPTCPQQPPGGALLPRRAGALVNARPVGALYSLRFCSEPIHSSGFGLRQLRDLSTSTVQRRYEPLRVVPTWPCRRGIGAPGAYSLPRAEGKAPQQRLREPPPLRPSQR